RTISEAKIETLDVNFDARGAFRHKIELDRIFQMRARDCRYFACHPVVAPKIGPMRNRLIVDLDREIGRAAGQRVSGNAGGKLEDSFMISTDTEFNRAGQHAVAFDSRDRLLPHCRIYSEDEDDLGSRKQ